MCLTEPQAAPTSASCARAPSPPPTAPTASPARKIFITGGEHDLTENIVHLVLARLPDAPPGIEGHLALRRAEAPRPDGAGRTTA